MIYTVTFNPAIDYVVRLYAPLEVGEVNRAQGEDCVLGGKGINVSGVLAQLGCESVALGFVAGETGAWLERGLAAQGLKTDFVHLENGMTRINVKIKAGQETELNGAGPAIPESALQQLEAQLDKLAEGDILILAGSIPASLPQSVYERLLARLQGRGVRAVVDATRDLLVNVLPYHPFLIKPNNHELGEIVGKVLTTDAEIVAAARTLQEKGARNVLVSMAGDGALLLDEQGQVHRIGCPKGKVVNSVGEATAWWPVLWPGICKAAATRRHCDWAQPAAAPRPSALGLPQRKRSTSCWRSFDRIKGTKEERLCALPSYLPHSPLRWTKRCRRRSRS